MAKIVTFANFKGGTGKTTTSTLLGYSLARMGKRTLVIDLDPQANATALLLKTYEVLHGQQKRFSTTLMSAVKNEDLSSAVINITDTLALLPSYRDFSDYSDYLEDIIPRNKRHLRGVYLRKLINAIRDDFDFILIDVPPTISIITESALNSSDYAIIIMQTHERSLVGAQTFIEEMIAIRATSNPNLELLGVLPVMLKSSSRIDAAILNKAVDLLGDENMFRTIIPGMERIKRWDIMGITNNNKDRFDRIVHAVFEGLAEEFIERIEEYEGI